MSWWDYGYQLSVLSESITTSDNNTWNTEHIAKIGRVLGLREEDAADECRRMGVDYVMVQFGGVNGYPGDDVNKFTWIAKIGQGADVDDPRPDINSLSLYDVVDENGVFTTSLSMKKRLSECVLMRFAYDGFCDVMAPSTRSAVERYGGASYIESNASSASLATAIRNDKTYTCVDRARKQLVSPHLATMDRLHEFEEVYTSSTWLVRIYKVKRGPNWDKIWV
ncbi:Oligosaccharyl transferase, STT3 subunit like protein [Aduncisulcus paluster]|uniref:Oligosaccharyl transferase, STT3 subunit like protein n=1 Tax=Aduncisulcus paluster TaxID=2918883 RepID=A0ABQ5K2T7_9EUKA|nr:Oligosaccharyl transferase, STT3 subunit like protein [Aduncisulcus paluster]